MLYSKIKSIRKLFGGFVMTYVTFSFDTEDYVNSVGADDVLRIAKLLKSHGITGCFNVVGRLAQALKKWGREDVIEALRNHEIETHSLAHSYHPTINEYTDLEDFDDALKLFLKQEGECLQILKDILGVEEVYAACPPGSSTSYVAHYGYDMMGIPCYDGDNLFDKKLHRPISCCNILCLDYVFTLVETLEVSDEAALLELVEKMAEVDYIVFCNHPHNFSLTQWWDGLNFKGKNTAEEDYILSAQRTKEEREELYAKFDFLLNAIKNDDRFKIVTYKEIAEIYDSDERVIAKETLKAVKPQLAEYFFPVTTPDSYCLADFLLACRDMLLDGADSHVCGKVYGFLNTPFAISEKITLTADEVKLALSKLGDRFLPEKFTMGDKIIGPADLLRAALEVVEGAEVVTVEPGPWQIDLDQFPHYRDLDYTGGWKWVHSDDFEDKYLSDRFRLQSWTIRLPKNTPRKIFFD
jgi:peptidoglycan/xylan/chitin deacetylase (PgdA/CDA1 family)